MRTRELGVYSIFLVAILLMGRSAHCQTLKVELNGLEIGIDQQTGSVVSLGSSATGVILRTAAESAGLLDLAYPVDSFAAMRLASRFSKARVIKQGSGVEIRWERLGASRPNLALPAGKVVAVVTMRAADDGKSVILSCHIENQSGTSIPQELFPDLWGLKPAGNGESTRLRLARGVVLPFADPIVPPDSAPFYAEVGWKEYPGDGGYYAENALRWLDYGSFDRGLSVFQKEWGTPERPDVLTYRSQRDPMSIRLAWQQKKNIEPGGSWDSGEFWLTPHRGGWAKGIELYRAYVKQVNPPREIPAHVRDGIGYQTIWMTQGLEVDPSKAAFRFADLPRVAADARQYGIDEMSVWGAVAFFTLPGIPVRSELGSAQDFVDGVRRAREEGVNITPLISIVTLLDQYAAHYGTKPGGSNWTYHPELVPQVRPYYSKASDGAWMESGNRLWREDALAAVSDWINRGLTSFTWDQFEGNEAMVTLAEEIRTRARAHDAQSVFGGESITNLEMESRVLDYTWNWVDYEDAALLSRMCSVPRD